MAIFIGIPMHEGSVLGAIQSARNLRTHRELFYWLQRDVRPFLRHDVLVAAWGDFGTGQVSIDVVSALPDMRTTQACCDALRPLVLQYFREWSEGGGEPLVVRVETPASVNHPVGNACAASLQRMHSAVIHGIKDERSWQYSLYVALSTESVEMTASIDAVGLLLPYIDAAFRQVAPLPLQCCGNVNSASEVMITKSIAAVPVGNVAAASLSEREKEIMRWVSVGKTNPEIGKILNISPITVRNHLQRIFRKLDVMNRAQAVFEIEQWSTRSGGHSAATWEGAVPQPDSS